MSQVQPGQRLRPFKPQRFGRYTLLLPLATGGMGEIFLARLEGAQGFEKLCVIKKILPHLAADPEFAGRFADEAKTLVKLAHGSIAHVLDMGTIDGASYIAMEFVDGKDLRRIVSRANERQQPLPIGFVLFVVTRMLDALGYAHRKKGDDGKDLDLVHRDVSPQNVLLSYEGEVKVIDFGLARSVETVGRTHPSIMVGKFMYMSPEQARHQKVDRRSDLYAVGITLWELVTGKNPFEGLPPGDVMTKVIGAQVPPLEQVSPDVPPAVAELVRRALAQDAGQRFQTAEEFRARAQAVLLEVDPAAGPESASELMQQLFGAEFQSERKMLAALREQAKALGADVPAESPELTLSPDDDALVPTPATAPKGPPPTMRLERPDVEALSFAPAPRGTASGRHPVLEQDNETRPGVAAPEARASKPNLDARMSKRSLPKVRDDALEAPAPAPTGRSVDGLPRARPPAKGQTPPRGSAPRAAVKPATQPSDTLETEATAPKGLDATEVAVPVALAPVKKRGGSPVVWFVLPLLVLAALGATVWWDLYTDKVKAQQLEKEAARATPEAEQPETRRSREVKVPGSTPAKPPDEELAAAPSKDAVKKPKPAPKPVVVAAAPAPATTSPGEAAYKQLRSNFDKLVNESAQKKYRMKVNVLGDKVQDRGGDPAFVKEVTALDQLIRDELAKPENQ